MNSQNAKDFLPLVQALAEGKTLQWRGHGFNWSDVFDLKFDYEPQCYRIKPEPRRWWILHQPSNGGRDVLWRHENPPRMPGDEVIEVVEVMK